MMFHPFHARFRLIKAHYREQARKVTGHQLGYVKNLDILPAPLPFGTQKVPCPLPAYGQGTKLFCDITATVREGDSFHGKQYVPYLNRDHCPANFEGAERKPQAEHPEFGGHVAAFFRRPFSKPLFPDSPHDAVA